MDSHLAEVSSFQRFQGGPGVELSSTVLRTIRKLESSGIFWSTELQGPPHIAIDRALVGGKRVLSIGSQEGSLDWRLARCGAARVVGVEGDAANYAKCLVLGRAFPELPLEFIHADVTDFDIPQGEFDLVYCLGVLYHLEQPQDHLKALRECGAVLINITTQLATDPPHPSTDEYRLGPRCAVQFQGKPYFGRRFEESFIDGREGLQSFWFYPEDLKSLVLDLGFQILNWQEIDYGQGGYAASLALQST